MILLTLACAAAAGYQVVAILACLRHILRPRPSLPATRPGVSILKPIRGADDCFLQAIRTQADIDYPQFEILFGLRDPRDSARPLIEQLQRERPDVAIRIVLCTTDAPNPKVGTLEDLGREARYPVWVVNDSDISVEPDYLDRLVAELDAPGTGLVTCLYRATGGTFAARMEALGIASDFTPSALVAQLVGVREFGLGSTLAFRAETLRRLGGFAAVRDYLGDDYQIGKLISSTGLRVRLSSMPVSTHMNGTWRDVWNHQVRWARTIRVSRSGYFGLPVTNASMWALAALVAGWWQIAVALLILRLTAAFLAAGLVLRDPLIWRFWWLVPFRDLFGLAVWVAGAFGSHVWWRGSRLKLRSDGRIG